MNEQDIREKIAQEIENGTYSYHPKEKAEWVFKYMRNRTASIARGKGVIMEDD